jgi:hypothetical protein
MWPNDQELSHAGTKMSTVQAELKAQTALERFVPNPKFSGGMDIFQKTGLANRAATDNLRVLLINLCQ